MYKGNYLEQAAPITDNGEKANTKFATIINDLVSRVFTSFIIGSGAPDAALGDKGDYYMELEANEGGYFIVDIHYKYASGWNPISLGNLTDVVYLSGPKLTAEPTVE